MALLVPAHRAQVLRRNYSGRATTTWGTTLTGSATPHALPASPTEVVTATAFEAEWIRITLHGMFVSATITDALVNIYIGDSGSETLFIDSLAAGWTSTVAQGSLGRTYWFPVRIARNTRISASLRNLIASDTCYIMVEYGVSNGSHWVGAGVETLGENTAASRGTSVTLGQASAGTATSMGTTSRRWRYCLPAVQGNNDTTAVAQWATWDVTNSGGTIIGGMDNFLTAQSATEWWEAQESGFWCDVPASTALYLSGQSHTAPSGVVYAHLHGVY
jgi:hypothetical protein